MITIAPENPTSDDHVEFTFLVDSCALGEISKTVVGSQFIYKVDHISMAPCVGPIPLVPLSWSIGRLKAGEYQVRHEEVGYDPVAQAFSVSQGELPFPTPPIPSLGFAGAILLAAVLAWIANKALKRTPKGAA